MKQVKIRIKGIDVAEKMATILASNGYIVTINDCKDVLELTQPYDVLFNVDDSALMEVKYEVSPIQGTDTITLDNASNDSDSRENDNDTTEPSTDKVNTSETIDPTLKKGKWKPVEIYEFKSNSCEFDKIKKPSVYMCDQCNCIIKGNTVSVCPECLSHMVNWRRLDVGSRENDNNTTEPSVDKTTTEPSTDKVDTSETIDPTLKKGKWKLAVINKGKGNGLDLHWVHKCDQCNHVIETEPLEFCPNCKAFMVNRSFAIHHFTDKNITCGNCNSFKRQCEDGEYSEYGNCSIQDNEFVHHLDTCVLFEYKSIDE